MNFRKISLPNIPQLNVTSHECSCWNVKVDKSHIIIFAEIVSLLPESSCLVINNTKVLPARLPGKRQTGAVIEALLVEEKSEGLWSAIVRKAGRINTGELLEFCGGRRAGSCATKI